MDLEELKSKLRDVFNKYSPAGIPIDKEDNYDEYDLEIKALLEDLSDIQTKEDIKKLLIEIFNSYFYEGIIKNQELFDKFSEEVFNIVFKK